MNIGYLYKTHSTTKLVITRHGRGDDNNVSYLQGVDCLLNELIHLWALLMRLIFKDLIAGSH